MFLQKKDVFMIFCLNRWLGDVAVFRYEHFHGSLNGTHNGVRFESGDLLPMDGIISDHL